MEFLNLILTLLIYVGIILFFIWVYRNLISNDYLNSVLSPDNQCNSADCLGKSKDCHLMPNLNLTSCTLDIDCSQCYGNMSCQEVSDEIILKQLNQNNCPSPLIWDSALNRCKFTCTYNTQDTQISLNQTDCTGDYLKWENNKCTISCQNSSKGLNLTLPKEKCNQPLIWDDNKKVCYLPKSSNKYCLPYQIPQIECNQYTGIKILAKETINDPYRWYCLCKDNTKFTNFGTIGGDCTGIQICDMQGKSNQQMNDDTSIPSSSKTFLVRQGTETSNTPDYWNPNKSYWNPFEQGVCKCGENQIANQITKTCSPSLCYPCEQDPKDSNKCICPDNSGYLDCYNSLAYIEDPIFGSYLSGICSPGTAIPNPCQAFEGDSKSIFDPNTKSCKCDTDNNFYPHSADQSPIGQKCSNICMYDNPCASRGTCYVITDDNKDLQSLWQFFLQGGCDINNPSNCVWLIVNQSGNKDFYLTTNSDMSLGLNQDSGSEYIIEPICSDQSKCIPVVSQLVNNNKYKLKDKQSNNYLFYDTSSNSISFSNQNSSPFTFTVFSDEGSQHESIGRLGIDNNLFIGLALDSSLNVITPLKISLNTLFKGSGRCKDCLAPFMQDSNFLCQTRCLPDGNGCDQDSSCCSLYCEHFTWSKPNKKCNGYYRSINDGDISEDPFTYTYPQNK